MSVDCQLCIIFVLFETEVSVFIEHNIPLNKRLTYTDVLPKRKIIPVVFVHYILMLRFNNVGY